MERQLCVVLPWPSLDVIECYRKDAGCAHHIRLALNKRQILKKNRERERDHLIYDLILIAIFYGHFNAARCTCKFISLIYIYENECWIRCFLRIVGRYVRSMLALYAVKQLKLTLKRNICSGILLKMVININWEFYVQHIASTIHL